MDTIVLKVDDFLTVAGTRGHTTYEQQAAATGLGVATLHRIRRGEPASSTAVVRVCQTYGVQFEDVFTFGTVTPARRTKRADARRVTATAA